MKKCDLKRELLVGFSTNEGIILEVNTNNQLVQFVSLVKCGCPMMSFVLNAKVYGE